MRRRDFPRGRGEHRERHCPDAEILEQYVPREGKYRLAQKSGTGDVRSVSVSGFCIPVRALFDAQVNLETGRGFLSLPPA